MLAIGVTDELPESPDSPNAGGKVCSTAHIAMDTSWGRAVSACWRVAAFGAPRVDVAGLGQDDLFVNGAVELDDDQTRQSCAGAA